MKREEMLSAKQILIVENGSINRDMVSGVLQKDGVVVRYANNMDAALFALVKTNPFLIVVDMVLPKLNAHSFSDSLKNDINTNHIKIVAFAKQLFTLPIVKPFDGLISTEGKEEVLINGIISYLEN
ncbi:MAG: response regulator [Bacteroidetes bacterium]|nr:response regulator [Bacteroidota bacterium]